MPTPLQNNNSAIMWRFIFFSQNVNLWNRQKIFGRSDWRFFFLGKTIIFCVFDMPRGEADVAWYWATRAKKGCVVYIPHLMKYVDFKYIILTLCGDKDQNDVLYSQNNQKLRMKKEQKHLIHLKWPKTIKKTSFLWYTTWSGLNSKSLWI